MKTLATHGLWRVWSAGLAAAGLCIALAAAMAARADEIEFGAKFQDDEKTAAVPLKADYAKAHPRMLFSAADVPAIKKKAADHPELWKQVIAHADSLTKREVPDAKEVSGGAHYWRIEYVTSGALAYLVTGDRKYLDATRNWMVRYSEGKIWGEGWGQNVDLHASWYLYHIGIAYDILRDELSDADRALIRDGLADHAKAIHESFDTRYPRGLPYAQNHTYIPVTGMVAGALAVMDEVPEARDWIKRGWVLMARSRHALGDDGYYYEGRGYWSYAFSWQVRYAELMGRATGRSLMAEPTLADSWLFALHTSLPGMPWGYDMGDTGRWADGKRGGSPLVSQHTYLWAVARANRGADTQLAGNFINKRGPEFDYPAVSFLWYDPSVTPAALGDVKPYHHFKDHDVVCWRSGWGDDATCLMFRCGPPQGHAAAKKLREMTDWRMNSGHTHPDIGAFWLYARGAYLAGDTGYTARKFTRDHNTLLVGGKGQGADGTYWNDRGWPYDKFDAARIVAVHLADDHVYARGEFGSVYPADLGIHSLQRTVLATKRWLLTIDNLDAKQEQTLTWLCHTDEPFKAEGRAYVSRKTEGALAIFPLVSGTKAEPEKTIVLAGTGPGEGTEAQRGYHLRVTSAGSSESPQAGGRWVQLVTLLVPLGADEKPPEAKLTGRSSSAATVVITWPDGTTETIKTDWLWVPAAGGAPAATITVGDKPAPGS